MSRLASSLLAATCAVATVVLSSAVAKASSAAAAPRTPTRTIQGVLTASRPSLAPGQRLLAGDQLVSPDGLHALAVQSDGNVVLRAGGVATWSTHTEGRRGAYLTMQSDGNLVLRQGRNAVWASGTASTGTSGRVSLSDQDDGNLVLYRSMQDAIWQSGTSDSALKQVRVRTGCPQIPSTAAQVPNAPEGLVTSLVPTGVNPLSALVCRYSGDFDPEPSVPKLLQATRLGATAATRLTTSLSRVILGFPDGIINCPSADGSRTIIALHYPHRSTDVDIAYSTSGCRLLDNGYVVAGQIGNTQFGVFQSVLSQLAPGSD